MAHQKRLADALRAAGLDVVEHRGWDTRGSPTFRPRAVVVHHTGPGTLEGLVRLVIDGRRDLPGPLCHILLAPDGACHIIAAGRANHAGAGSWRGVRGNTNTWGIEAIHPGDTATPWPEIQLRVFPVAAAALCRLSGIDPSMVCGHKEWTTRKIDPVAIAMDGFRRQVAAQLDIWTRPPPVVVHGPVHDIEEATVKTMLMQIALDDGGNGWSDWNPNLGRDPHIVGVVKLGPSPPDDGYWLDQAPAELSAQPRDGAVRVTCRGGTPRSSVSCWVSVA